MVVVVGGGSGTEDCTGAGLATISVSQRLSDDTEESACALKSGGLPCHGERGKASTVLVGYCWISALGGGDSAHCV